MSREFARDYYAYTGKRWGGVKDRLQLLASISLKIVYLGRKCQNANNLKCYFFGLSIRGSLENME